MSELIEWFKEDPIRILSGLIAISGLLFGIAVTLWWKKIKIQNHK